MLGRATPTALGEHHGPFWFSGPEGALEGRSATSSMPRRSGCSFPRKPERGNVGGRHHERSERKVRVYVLSTNGLNPAERRHHTPADGPCLGA